MAEQRQVLLNNKNRTFSRCASNAHDELHSFRSWLRWMCVDQSDSWTVCLSWIVFFAFGVIVPAVSHFGLDCGECDDLHSRPFDAVAQVSLSAVSALSFLCLSGFVRKYGLRRFLFFDKLREESETVRKEYTLQFKRSLSILFVFVLPGFAVECAYKIWWYTSGGTRIPFLGNFIVSNTVACILELCSWFYRTVLFFLVCLLFRLICCLQILQMQDFAVVFLMNSDVKSILVEHNRIRRHLRIISHRYRAFILLALIFITASLFASLLVTTRPGGGDISILHSGELALCSVSLLVGLMILLRSAARITHKAQAVTALAAKWHVCATIESFDASEAETLAAHNIEVERDFPDIRSYDSDEVGDEEDEVDSTKLVPSSVYSSISFQKRQALVTYFENNRAGITVYGFMLDRSSLHTIFCIELSLVLWLLGKTIGIS